MTENRFFTWIWRYNGLIIALAATLILGMLIWEISRDLRRAWFPTQTRGVLNVAPSEAQTPAPPANTEQVAYLGAPNICSSCTIYAFPRFVEQTYPNRSVSKVSKGNHVNYLVVDPNDASQRWLFPAGPRLITEVRPLRKDQPNSKRNLRGYLLMVVEEDSNQDRRLSSNDAARLYFVSPEWAQPKPLIGDISALLDVRIGQEGWIDITYQTAGLTHLRRFAGPAMEQTLDMMLSPTP